MLQKTYEIEMTDLVEKAKSEITSSKQVNSISFVPYVDEQLGEIRYLKFFKIDDHWEYLETNEGFHENCA